MKLDIPYYSQYRDVKDENWQKKACGLVCLKMVLDFYRVETPTMDDFLESALERKSFGENGWTHSKLVEIVAGFGLKAGRKEFKFENCLEEKVAAGLSYIVSFLEQGRPVLVSVAKKFKYPEKFHQVVLTGFENDDGQITGFYYNDPDYQNEGEGKNIFVSIKIFEKYWRKLAIFVHN